MRAGQRSKRRTALLVCVGVLAAALVFVLLSRPQSLPPTAGIEPAPAAALRGDSTVAEGAVDAATSLPAERTAVASVPSRMEESTTILLEVRDSAARLVPGARVFVSDGEGRRVKLSPAGKASALHLREGALGRADGLGGVTPNGTMHLPPGVAIEAMAGWRAAVTLPGLNVSQPVRLSRPGVVTIDIGDVGTLRIVCDGAAAGLELQVLEFRDGALRGPPGRAPTSRGSADVQVAAGGLRYQVAGFGGLRNRCFVVGPRSQGDVVEVHPDLRTCRVTGELVNGGTAGGGELFALLVAADETESYRAELQGDGPFSVLLPRIHCESIVFARGPLCGVCPPVTLDADERSVGPITMTTRPRLGRLEVRDPQGRMQAKQPNVLYFTSAAGTRVRSRPSLGPFFEWHVQNEGIECFAIPGITEVAVSPQRDGLFTVPRVVVMRDGGVFRANLVEGGRVVVLLSAPGIPGLCDLWLEEVATKQRVPRRMAQFEHRQAGLQSNEFLRVAPGSYQVCAKGIEIVGGSLEVLGGSEQEIAVSMRPQ